MSDLTASELDLVVFLRRGMLVPAIAVVAKLGIPDLVDAGPKQAGELAAATGAHAPSLYRLLRTLAGAGLFNEDEQGRFALTPSGAGLRRGGAARELALVFGAPFIWAAWGKLEHSVLTGESAFAHAHRLNLFEYLQQSPEADAVFHAWMTRQSELQIPGILAAYDFSRFRRVVDIGGGRGALLAAILQANPGVAGTLFDLDDVVSAGTLLDAPELARRSTVLAGSFFDTVPAGADCYLLKLVIHDWDDDQAALILGNIRSAISDHGRLVLIEFVIRPGNDDDLAELMDMSMLVLTEGGRVRTQPEHEQLLRTAGFDLTSLTPTESGVTLLEATPR